MEQAESKREAAFWNWYDKVWTAVLFLALGGAGLMLSGMIVMGCYCFIHYVVGASVLLAAGLCILPSTVIVLLIVVAMVGDSDPSPSASWYR